MRPPPLVRLLVSSLLVLVACKGADAPGADATSAGPTASAGGGATVEPDTTPEGTLGRFLAACVRAGDEATRAAALRDIQALVKPLVADDDWTRRPSNRTFVERLATQPWIFRSYAPGATPDNAYAASPDFQPEITSRRDEGGALKLWIRSGGADSPRPVSLVRPEGQDRWLIQEWSSLYVEVRRPR